MAVTDCAAEEFVFDEIRVEVAVTALDEVTLAQRRGLAGTRGTRRNDRSALPVATRLGEVEIPLDDLLQRPVPTTVALI